MYESPLGLRVIKKKKVPRVSAAHHPLTSRPPWLWGVEFILEHSGVEVGVEWYCFEFVWSRVQAFEFTMQGVRRTIPGLGFRGYGERIPTNPFDPPRDAGL